MAEHRHVNWAVERKAGGTMTVQGFHEAHPDPSPESRRRPVRCDVGGFGRLQVSSSLALFFPKVKMT
ncbi:hypothetical protein MTO96_011343 [Rhipicephalus appendiculatus]